MLSSCCEFNRHIGMLSSCHGCAFDRHIGHYIIMLCVRQTHRGMLSSCCEFHRHIIMLSSCCEFHRHIGGVLSSCCEFDRHIGGVLSSCCEFDRHIGMRSSSCDFESLFDRRHIGMLLWFPSSCEFDGHIGMLLWFLSSYVIRYGEQKIAQFRTHYFTKELAYVSTPNQATFK